MAFSSLSYVWGLTFAYSIEFPPKYNMWNTHVRNLIPIKKSKKIICNYLGFQKIIDLDKELAKQNNGVNKQEDLQIHDGNTTLLIEIKGLSHLPRETATMQIVKYVSRRMKEWGRTNVHGVSIINHQKNLPALQRENNNVFTEPQLEDAQNHDITLLTTWDLFLLTRGMLKWGWEPKTIQELFYQEGRMSRFPTIYEPVGRIEKFWGKINVVGIRIMENTLLKGQRISYILPTGYLEEEVSSLQCEKRDVSEVLPGQLAGVKTKYSKDVLAKGTVVCKVG